MELGFAKELATASRVPLVGGLARQKLFDELLRKGLERGEAVSVARTLETDDVLDPADSRRWLINGMDTAAASGSAEWRRRKGKKRPLVSPW